MRSFSAHDQGRIRKFLYPAWLPTNNQQHRMNPHVDHRCPQCFTVYETATHLIKCRASNPTGERQSWQQELETWMEKQHTFPHLRSLISDICAWRFLDTPVSQPTNNALHQVFYTQQTLGWDALFRGYVTHELLALQDRFLRTLHVDQRVYTAAQWGKELIAHIWRLLLRLWHTRCEAQHCQDSTLAVQRRREHLLARVRRCYNQRSSMLPRHQSFFDISWQDRQVHDPERLETWLANVESILPHSVAAQQRQTKTTHNPITTYFQPRAS